MIPQASDCLILGAGAAGLAAAVRMAQAGRRPLVLEAAPRPGGRVSSHADALLGEELDNGPHLLVGACREALDLLAILGTKSLMTAAPGLSLAWWTPGVGHYRLQAPDWPAPGHLLAALWRFPPLSGRDRWSALRLGIALARRRVPPPDWTVTQWLQATGQTPTLLRRLWGPLCLAILNEPPASASALLYHAALGRILLGRPEQGAHWLPRTPWSHILAEPARAFVIRQGGAVACRVRAIALECQDGRVTGVVTSRGTIQATGAVISALPERALERLAAPWWRRPGEGAAVESPIISVHLRYTRPARLPAPLVGLPEGVSQWLVERGELSEPTRPGGARLSAVISAAYREIHWPSRRLIETVHGEVAALLPQLAASPPQGRVIRERRATRAAWPDQAATRPGPVTPWSNLWLAGDWTATGLPATIEGAVASGRKAAALALQRLS
ncbi:MAG: FAD-dependent oxidoreductase [Magnetococcales bacterium]|nr:FAD-dependent oxidoreductase [Magnetococcales bacterium]